MATLTFTGSRPTPRQKSVLVVGQVNAEPITVVVDDSWSGLQLELQFFHSVTHQEVPVVHILDETMTCNVPPEVTKEVGVVHVALAGRDSGTIIKLSEKLYYADAKIGADPQGGLTPEQQTPDYIAQMIAIQEETKAVAQSVRSDADNGLFDGEPGKSPIIKNGNWWIWDVGAQEYRDTGVAASGGGGGGTTDYTELSNKPKINGIELLGNKTAQDLGLQPKGDYAKKTDIPTMLPSPYTLTFAGAVEADYDGSKDVTVTIPMVAGPPGVSPTVSTEEIDGGTRVTFTFQGGSETVDILNGTTPIKGIDYFTEAEKKEIAKQAAALVPGGGGGSSGGEVMLAEYIHRGNQEIQPTSIDWESAIVECAEPHGLTEATQVMLVWNDWMTGNVYANATAMPIEWTSLDQNLFLLPTDDTHVMVVGNDKSTPITVDASNGYNVEIDATKIHFEVPVGFQISDIPELYTKVQLTILGVVMGAKRYRYIAFVCRKKDGKDILVNTIDLLYPPYFGTITKPRHGLLTSHNITLELNNVVGGSFLYSNYFAGRRDNYVGFPGEVHTEIKRAIQPYKPAEFLGVTGISVYPTFAVWANGTRFRLYGLCKGGEHK